MLADGEDFQRSFQLKRHVSPVFCTSTSRHEHWMRSAVQTLNRVQWSCQRWFVIFLSSVQWSVLRPTYVRCPTKHTNFMYRQGCIWMKVCQRWCKLDRGPLQAHCAWKCPLASWNMQLPWLDSVPAGSQSLHKHSPTMFSWELTICGACPTVKLVEQVCLDWKDKACNFQRYKTKYNFFAFPAAWLCWPWN